MITFYPNKIEQWQDLFDFDDITLSMGVRQSESFYNRAELMDFLKHHGIILTDAQNPLMIIDHGGPHFTFGHGVSDIFQGSTLIGWIKDNHR